MDIWVVAQTNRAAACSSRLVLCKTLNFQPRASQTQVWGKEEWKQEMAEIECAGNSGEAVAEYIPSMQLLGKRAAKAAKAKRLWDMS